MAVALGVGACAPAPTPSIRPGASGPPLPTPTASNGISSSPSPTTAPPSVPPPSAPPVSHLGEHWTILTGLPKLAEFGGAAYGDHGWVVVGDCGGNSCGTGGGAQAFWSTDGLSWSRAPVKTGKNAIMGHAVWAAGSYWASGMAYTDPSVTDPGVAHFWRSDDGRSWDQIGTINLGPCRKSSCPYIGPMAVNPTG